MTGYDFDKTIYDGDCFIDFYKYCLYRRIYLIFFIPIQLIMIVFVFYNKKYLKQAFATYLLLIYKKDILIEGFWNKNMSKLRNWYFRQKREDDIIISASPYFLLTPICQRIGVKNLIATNMNFSNGVIKGKNCYGKEKTKAFLQKYPNTILEAFYTDSKSDFYIMAIAIHGYMVTKNNLIQIK